MVALVACVTDLRSRRIYDWLTYPAMLAGLILGYAEAQLPGLVWSFFCLTLSGGVFLLPALVGGMGGGDAKLMAAFGALLSFPLALHALLYAALCGAVLAVAMATARGDLWRAIRNIAAWLKGLLRVGAERPSLGENSQPYVPYGVGIAAGALWAAAGRYLPELLIS